jgi:hypothetical protein
LDEGRLIPLRPGRQTTHAGARWKWHGFGRNANRQIKLLMDGETNGIENFVGNFAQANEDDGATLDFLQLRVYAPAG